MSYRFFIVDVFTEQAFGGNQLAVLPAADAGPGGGDDHPAAVRAGGLSGLSGQRHRQPGE